MDTFPQPTSTPPTNYPPPYAPPVGQAPSQPTKSGCGCCGCLAGCFALILIPPILFLILYFTVDLGKVGDQTMIWSYYNVVRPRIIEPAMKNASEEEKKRTLLVMDHYVQAYQTLPDAERKLVRQEAFTYLYYQSQNQQPPPEKVAHLNKFIQDQIKTLQSQYPHGSIPAPPRSF
jgi:hypothetical protein